MKQDFVHLHVHSTHSYLDGYGTPRQLLERAKELGFEAMALTDHGVLDGLIQFYFVAKELGIKPVLGVEGYLCQNMRERDRKMIQPIISQFWQEIRMVLRIYVEL